jgi:hypothetical protein
MGAFAASLLSTASRIKTKDGLAVLKKKKHLSNDVNILVEQVTV